MAASSPTPTAADLRQALDDADLRVLLMVLHHLTGERRWLAAPFLPDRDVRLIADESAGFSGAIQDEIRAAAFDLLLGGAPEPVVTDLDSAGVLEMLGACLGEAVPAEYGPLLLQDLGMAPRGPQPAWDAEATERISQHDVVVVGAGVSGVGMALELRRLGFAVTVLERNDDVGGTWYENRYPGAGVDTPNLFYSFAGRPNSRWSRYFSRRDELLDYVRKVVADEGLSSDIRFSTSLERATWNDAEGRWRIEVSGPAGTETLTCRHLISAIGHISEPNAIRFEGAEDFDGPLFHTARWPDGVDLAGKRVAVVGTGATSMQLCPTIVDEVDHLTVYQRSAQWARPTPEYHREVSEASRWLFEHVPFYAAWYRITLFWRYGDGLLRFLRRDPDWEHPERAMNRINDRHRQQMTEHIVTELAARPDLVDACVPDYPPYGKRILLDNGWFEMLCRDDVELVTDAVATIDATGITTAGDDGTHRDHDVIIMATGFSIARLAARLDIHGIDGTLAQAWAPDNPTGHLGISVPGFPNFFMLYGPNTNLAHGGSAIFHAECQTRYIAAMLCRMVEADKTVVEVSPEARDRWVDAVDAEHAELVWAHPRVDSWYANDAGRVVSVSPFRLVDYWAMTSEPELDDFTFRP